MTKFLTVSKVYKAYTTQKYLDKVPVCASLTQNKYAPHMKVAIALTDQSFQRTKSMGIFNVSMGLAKGLMNCPEVTELHILGNNECGDAFKNCPPHVHVHLTDKPVPRRFARVWWDQFGLCAAVRKIKPDWVILPKGVPPFFPCFGKAKMACYVHDVMWEYYEKLSQKGENPFPWYENIYFKALGKRALRKADLVLTSTQFNKTRFEAHYARTNTVVIGIGFDDKACISHSLGNKKDVLFFASTFPHKLTELAVSRMNAWLEQRPDRADIKIHVLGKVPPHVTPQGNNWILKGRISPQELTELMAGQCCISVYFSDYEGFGMPPVESLRAGLPCVASDIPPIRENIPAQYLFNNADEADFIAKANAAYDKKHSFICPEFPTWQEVCNRCVQAMLQH